MRKIGMLTFYNEKNYGAMLQAYALQSNVIMAGYEAEFINFIDYQFQNKSIEKKALSESKIKKSLTYLKMSDFSVSNFFSAQKQSMKKEELFNDFVERNMRISRKAYYSLTDLQKGEINYDGFLVGSDMVWSDLGQSLSAYFLTFTSPQKRLSYAPSLTGRDNENPEERARYKKWVEEINFLSCREQYGIDYIKSLSGRDAKLVVDPTLLFDKEQWVKHLSLLKRNEKSYILCYMFGGVSSYIKKHIEKYAIQNNLEVIYIPINIADYVYDIKHGFDAAIGPKEFVELFYNASFVITNSFHGLLFSLIMNKPYYLIHRGEGNEWEKHEERMTNILQLVSLENRFIYEKNLPDKFDFYINYDDVNSRISKLREDSLNYLKEALDSVTEREKNRQHLSRDYFKIDELETNSCTGCATCFNSCPTHAIMMKSSDEGFLFPDINEGLCMNCGICAKKCPQINPVELIYPIQTFCGTGNIDLVKCSASGGAFVTFAKYVIKVLHGVVYGATLHMPEGRCEHIEVDSMDNICLLQNSKYVQSNICDALPKCKERLEHGIYVLFSGTPCQIAALKKYLGKNYSNLVTVDIICHGVPSPGFFKQYVENEIPSSVSDLRFRHRLESDKRRSAYDVNYEENGKTVIKPGMSDLYYKAFINEESYRECCYDCQYAREERVSDITIGDCDSYRLYPGLEDNNIISSILVNTKKGNDFWNNCSDMFTFTKMNYKEECIINHPLRRPSSRPSRRDFIYKELQEGWSKYKNKNQKKNGIEQKAKNLILKMIKLC